MAGGVALRLPDRRPAGDPQRLRPSAPLHRCRPVARAALTVGRDRCTGQAHRRPAECGRAPLRRRAHPCRAHPAVRGRARSAAAGAGVMGARPDAEPGPEPARRPRPAARLAGPATGRLRAGGLRPRGAGDDLDGDRWRGQRAAADRALLPRERRAPRARRASRRGRRA